MQLHKRNILNSGLVGSLAALSMNVELSCAKLLKRDDQNDQNAATTNKIPTLNTSKTSKTASATSTTSSGSSTSSSSSSSTTSSDSSTKTSKPKPTLTSMTRPTLTTSFTSSSSITSSASTTSYTYTQQIPTVQSKYIFESHNVSGTVFIAVGTILLSILSFVILLRLIFACRARRLASKSDLLANQFLLSSPSFKDEKHSRNNSDNVNGSTNNSPPSNNVSKSRTASNLFFYSDNHRKNSSNSSTEIDSLHSFEKQRLNSSNTALYGSKKNPIYFGISRENSDNSISDKLLGSGENSPNSNSNSNSNSNNDILDQSVTPQGRKLRYSMLPMGYNNNTYGNSVVSLDMINNYGNPKQRNSFISPINELINSINYSAPNLTNFVAPSTPTMSATSPGNNNTSSPTTDTGNYYSSNPALPLLNNGNISDDTSSPQLAAQMPMIPVSSPPSSAFSPSPVIAPSSVAGSDYSNSQIPFLNQIKRSEYNTNSSSPLTSTPSISVNNIPINSNNDSATSLSNKPNQQHQRKASNNHWTLANELVENSLIEKDKRRSRELLSHKQRQQQQHQQPQTIKVEDQRTPSPIENNTNITDNSPNTLHPRSLTNGNNKKKTHKRPPSVVLDNLLKDDNFHL
ncbi:hypothetical protein BVG19_g5685 [[Candida] boidinii]|nr:hypothetical protein BVG19_g5685 [[Candida] boidinii]OWB54099.1 hypothetical protein B5S27_g5731 [[Candida] boidinii]